MGVAIQVGRHERPAVAEENNMIRLSRRVTDTAEKSYGMCDKAAAFVPQDGLIHLELGRPYYDTPQHIKDEIGRAHV